MSSILSLNKYIVFRLTEKFYYPFEEKSDGFYFEKIADYNLEEVTIAFSKEKMSALEAKLRDGYVGVFSKREGQVVGYLWRKDYDTSREIMVDGYVPLKGVFSHLSWGRVEETSRGHRLQRRMYTWLINDALSQGAKLFYTDIDISNTIAIQNAKATGFEEEFRLLIFKSSLTWRVVSFKYSQRLARIDESLRRG